MWYSGYACSMLVLLVTRPPLHQLRVRGYHELGAIGSWHELCDFDVAVAYTGYAHSSHSYSFVDEVSILVRGPAPVTYVHFSVLIHHVPHGHSFDDAVGCVLQLASCIIVWLCVI